MGLEIAHTHPHAYTLGSELTCMLSTSKHQLYTSRELGGTSCGSRGYPRCSRLSRRYRSNLWREAASHVPPRLHTAANRNSGVTALARASAALPPGLGLGLGLGLVSVGV